MTGKEILEEEFERAGMRGYRADQVDAFLQKVAAYIDEQETAKKDFAYKVQILAEKIEEYKKDEENIREALLGAQKLGNQMLNEAKTKAETLTRESKSTADEMLSQAKAKVESLTKDSLQKANLDLSSIKRECDMEQRRFEMLKQEISAFRASLLKQYKQHLDLVSNLPTQEDKLSTPLSREPVKAEPANIHVEAVEENPVPAPTPARHIPEEPKEEPSVPQEPAQRAQTIQSEIPQDETVQEIEREEREQTKEFNSGKDASTDRGDGSRKNGRPNYIEKFGELKFGGFGEGEK